MFYPPYIIVITGSCNILKNIDLMFDETPFMYASNLGYGRVR